MAMGRTVLLAIDGLINVALGVLLVVFPRSLVSALGIPNAPGFYSSILGGVLFGVGIALFLEGYNKGERGIGLGLGGAITINLCAGVVLAAWVLFGDLSIPIRGFVFLSFLVLVLVGISVLELVFVFRSHSRSATGE